MRIGRQRRIDQLIEPLAQLRRGPPLVQYAAQQRDLLGPVLARLGRDDGPVVPLQQGVHPFQQCRLADVLADFFVQGLGRALLGHGVRFLPQVIWAAGSGPAACIYRFEAETGCQSFIQLRSRFNSSTESERIMP